LQGHIRKRGNGWQIAIYLGKEGDKKKYKYVTVNGTKKDAQRVMTDLLRQMDTNCYVDPGRITLAQYLERWLKEYCAPRLAPRTYKRYEEIVNLHIVPDIGNVFLSRLQPLDLQAHYTRMLTRGRKGRKHGKKKGLSPTTVLFHHRIIHKALEQAVRWQLVGRNVADAVEPPAKAEVEYRIINNATLLKILDVMKEKCPVLIVPLMLAASTGMRRGEVLALRWSDFNYDTRRLSVTQQIQRIDGELVMRTVKTNRSKRPVPISEPIAELLKLHKNEQNKARLQLGQAYNNNDLICCWEDGRPIDPDYFTKRFIKFAQNFILGVRLHDLRHSFATMLLEKNVNIKKVSAVLGHSSISITGDIYSHLTMAMEDEVADVVGNAFSGLDCQEIVKAKKKASSQKLKAL
jgi:integrase